MMVVFPMKGSSAARVPLALSRFLRYRVPSPCQYAPITQLRNVSVIPFSLAGTQTHKLRVTTTL